jgi:tetratricopeptide (TPR) repeat protein
VIYFDLKFEVSNCHVQRERQIDQAIMPVSVSKIQEISSRWKESDYQGAINCCSELLPLDSSVTWPLFALCAADHLNNDELVIKFSQSVLERDATHPLPAFIKAKTQTSNASDREAVFARCYSDPRLPTSYRNLVEAEMSIAPKKATADIKSSVPQAASSTISHVKGEKKAVAARASTAPAQSAAPKAKVTARPNEVAKVSSSQPADNKKVITKVQAPAKKSREIQEIYTKAEKLEADGRYLEARQLFEQAVKLGWDEADDDIGRMHLFGKHYDKALAVLKDRHTVEAMLVRLSCEEAKLDWEEAAHTASMLMRKVKPVDQKIEGRLARAMFFGDARGKGTDLAQALLDKSQQTNLYAIQVAARIMLERGDSMMATRLAVRGMLMNREGSMKAEAEKICVRFFYLPKFEVTI